MYCIVCHLYHAFGAYSILFLNCSYTFSFSNESIAKCRDIFNSMKNNKTDESIRKHNNNNYWFDIESKPIQDNNPFLFSSTYHSTVTESVVLQRNLALRKIFFTPKIFLQS